MHFRADMLEPMDTGRAADAFAELFSELYLRLYQRMDPRAWRPSQEALLVLGHLASTGPVTITEAARHFDRSQSAVSELVARLVRRGLLATMEDERDRRRHLVWLTDQGLELLRRTHRVLSPELLEAAFDRLDPDEREQLIRILRRLLEATTTNPTDDWNGP
jgi:DNA-binding MarR family transcriptional regulator